jgi:hypothetical protein
MRGKWLMAAVGLLSLLAARGDDATGPFAGSVLVEHGCVRFYVDANERAWLNGERILARQDRLTEVIIRPGDTLVYAAGREFGSVLPIEARTFGFYHLESVNGGIARFAVRRYSVRTELYRREGVRIFPDRLLAAFTELVGPHEAVDGGPGDFFGVGVHSPEEKLRSK